MNPQHFLVITLWWKCAGIHKIWSIFMRRHYKRLKGIWRLTDKSFFLEGKRPPVIQHNPVLCRTVAMRRRHPKDDLNAWATIPLISSSITLWGRDKNWILLGRRLVDHKPSVEQDSVSNLMAVAKPWVTEFCSLSHRTLPRFLEKQKCARGGNHFLNGRPFDHGNDKRQETKSILPHAGFKGPHKEN